MKKLVLALVAVAAVVLSGSAEGASVSSGVKSYTVSGTGYSFSVAGAPMATGGGVLFFDAVGDFNNAGEKVTITAGTESFTAARFGSSLGASVVYDSSDNIVSPVYPEVVLAKLRVAFALTKAQVDTILNAGLVNVAFANSVGAPGFANGLAGKNSFSSTQMYYAVPGPASLAILGLGGLGALVARRRRK